jgi:hypothetical protein
MTKPWYRSMTIWAAIFLFYCGAAETYIAVWYPLLGAESVVLDRQEVITMALKTMPLLGSVIGLAGVILGRTRADTKLGFIDDKSK